MWDKSIRRKTVTLLLFVVTLGLLLSSAFHSRAQDDEGDVVAATPTLQNPTTLSTLPAPTGLTWDPETNEFSWNKVENAANRPGDDCADPIPYRAVQIRESSSQGHSKDYRSPIITSKISALENKIFCPADRDSCFVRWDNVSGDPGNLDGSTHLTVKACGDGVNWSDSPEATLVAHDSSTLISGKYCNESPPYRLGYREELLSVSFEYPSHDGHLYCTTWHQMVCIHHAFEFEILTTSMGNAIKAAFKSYFTDPAIPFAASVRSVIEHLRLSIDRAFPSGVLFIEQGFDLRNDPVRCIREIAYPPPTIIDSNFGYEGQIYVKWESYAAGFDIRIDGRDSDQDIIFNEIWQRVGSEGPPWTYVFNYESNLPPDLPHVFQIQANMDIEGIREYGQPVFSKSDWVAVEFPAAIANTPTPTSTPSGG